MGHDDIKIFVDQIVRAFAALKGLHPFHISLGTIGDDDAMWIGVADLLGQLADPWLSGLVCSGSRINKERNFDRV